MHTIYAHEPLSSDRIRLLTLFPGHGEVQISFSHERFTDVNWPRYEALSYTWGDTTNAVGTVEVISERSTSTPRPKAKRKGRHQQQHVQQTPTAATIFAVTENLYTALLLLRGREPRVLWIDAICIDQDNLEEKSRQIWKMGNIYRNAEKVVVWLGPTSEDSTRGLEVLSHLGQQVEFDIDTWKVHRNPEFETKCSDWYKDDSMLPYEASTWQAIKGIFLRPWFSRVWIRQEIGLADQTRVLVQCGDTEIRWKYFSNAVAAINRGPQKKPKVDLEQFNRALEIVWSTVSQDATTPLMNLLDTTRHCFCFDPRDRLFAMLDLAADSSVFEIRPDYTKPVSEIYKEFFITYCQALKNVELLQFCDAREWSPHHPSWVPLWDKDLPYRDSFRGWPSSATGTFEALEDGTLGVDGIFCGTISACTSTAPFLTFEDVAPLLRLWIQDELHLDLRTDGYDALCNIVSCQLLRDRYLEETPDASLAEATTIIKHILHSTPEPNLLEILSFPGASDILDSISTFLSCRRMSTTNSGTLGLGPSSLLPNDIICAILGCTKLLVLRKNTLKDTYRIVGHCNLQGYMDLEAFLGALPDGYRVAEEEPEAWAYEMWFVDSEGGRSRVDPRMGEGHPGWECEERDGNGNGYVVWENVAGGERTYHDPRHSCLGFLKERGTKVEHIILE